MIKRRKKSNPNGANQFLVDPRQSFFLSYYLDPDSDTFSNGKQSALKAGYAQEYAESILDVMPKWLSDNIGQSNMVRKAERNLDKILDLETREPIITIIGVLKDKESGEVITKENSSLLKVQADVSKFVAERLARKRYGNEKSDIPLGNITNNFTQIVINPPVESGHSIERPEA